MMRLRTSQAALALDTIKRLTVCCAFCETRIDGEPDHYAHRDGFGIGPEVPLCTDCGADEIPTLNEIWAKTGEAVFCIECGKTFTARDERQGSYHKSCWRGGDPRKTADFIASKRRRHF